MPSVFVHSQKFCDGQTAHLADDIHIQPAVVRLGFRRCTETTAIGAAIADGTHKAVHCQGLAVNGVLYSSANMPAQLFYDGKRIGRFAAAQRDAPELRDAVGDLRIQTGSADGGRKTETGLHQVNGDRPACKLGVQIQKFRFCAKSTQEIIAAAIGQAAHSRIFKPIDAGEGFIEGAIAACCIDAELLPCLPGLPGCGIGKLPGVACVGSDPNGIFSPGKTGPRRSRIDLPRQSTGTVCLAGSGVQKK